MMWTSELLDMVVLDRAKPHERMQKHAVRCDVSVTLDSGRQHKPLENMAKPDMGSRIKAHEYYTKVNLDLWTGKRG
ncbi:hypothetical protein [Desulfotignum balticum]|uniref:hypothetical protein n=1 Tax=Desulfotignum balticum TaxID=115781 RepID=UPI0004624D9C|nr:hypothetical protein [Desulfotignum balticum]